MSTLLARNPLDFTAARAGTGVQLNWTKKDESSISSYAVERSTDGVHFVQVGLVDLNKSNAGQYHFTDNNTSTDAKTVYYRVRANEVSKAYFYSVTRGVSFASLEDAISVYPNPIASTATVILPGVRGNA
jgi:hypothetical protein